MHEANTRWLSKIQASPLGCHYRHPHFEALTCMQTLTIMLLFICLYKKELELLIIQLILMISD